MEKILSTIKIVGTKELIINKDRLINGLYYRYNLSKIDAENLIEQAIINNIVQNNNDEIYLKLEN